MWPCAVEQEEEGRKEKEGEKERKKKKKGERRKKEREREREIAPAEFAAATAAGQARAPIGNAQRDMRNEGKKRMGRRLNSGVGTAKIFGKEFEGLGVYE